MALGAAGALDHATPAVAAGMFHLFTHAFFKALLFLAAGSVMHAMGDVIDMRHFSGLKRILPITHWTFLCGALALAGFPFLSGFWSKDEILGVLAAASKHPQHGPYYYWILMIASVAALLTAFYTFRAYFMTFWGAQRFPEEAGHHPHESPPAMAWPLRILAVCAVLVGVSLGPTALFAGYLHHAVGLDAAGEHEPNVVLMIASGLMAIAGIGVAWTMYVLAPSIPIFLSIVLRPLYVLSVNKFFFDEIYGALLVAPLRGLAQVATGIDKNFIDGLIDGLGRLPQLLSAVPRRVHNGLVPSYALVMFVGVLVGVVYVLKMWP
jgi:NADH-quinone oxidoreductase subunit L